MDDNPLPDPGANDPLPLPHGEPRPGLYRHYKGGQYRVLGLARHSESLEPMVLYQALYGTQGLWVRPQAMFLETVHHAGATVPRFARVAEQPDRSASDPT
jgi:hypothetical protein